MPNDIRTSAPIAPIAVELLARTLVLPMTVLRVPDAAYLGSGGTVSVRVRAPRLAHQQVTKSADIDFDDIDEFAVPVALEHWYNATVLSDDELDLHIVNFAEQVTAPQIDAVGRAAENQLAAKMNALDTTPLDATHAPLMVLEARRRLTELDVPLGRRYLAVGPQFAEELIGDPNLSDVSQAGSPSALRDAVVGRLYGFTVIESNAIDTDKAVAYHESAFAFASFAPKPAAGARSVTSAIAQGVAVRASVDWIPTKLSHGAIVDTYTGAGTIVEDDDDTIARVISFELGGS